MRKLISGALITALLLTVIIAGCGLQKGLTEVADKFFRAVAAGDYDTALQYVSSGFKRSTSVEKLQNFLESRGLTDYASANWSSWKLTTEQGTLEGTITNQDGSTVPVTLVFVKQGEDWRIHYIDAGPAGVTDEETAEAPLPDDATARQLVDDSMMRLAQAINTADFGDFYNHISQLWQSQTEPDTLQTYFHEFIDQGIDLTTIANLEPVLSDPPAIDDDGVLHLKGYYTTQPTMTYFDLKYIYEHPDWKLIGVNVKTE